LNDEAIKEKLREIAHDIKEVCEAGMSLSEGASMLTEMTSLHMRLICLLLLDKYGTLDPVTIERLLVSRGITEELTDVIYRRLLGPEWQKGSIN
jgi:hypothetical protein